MKKILTNLINNKKIRSVFIYISLFFFIDIIFSNFIYKNNIKSNCLINKNSFYFLDKNCQFKQKYIKKTPSYTVYTNNFGLRYSGKIYEKNKKNIFYFGDSFTYGLGLNFKKIYVGQIEKKEKNFNHLNFGLQGYSPTVYLHQLKSMIAKGVIPEKIFLTLDFTDILEEDKWLLKGGIDHPTIKEVKSSSEIEKDSVEEFKDKNLKATRYMSQVINNFFRDTKLSLLSKGQNVTSIPGKIIISSFTYSEDSEFNIDRNSLNRGFKKTQKKLIEISKLAKIVGSDFYVIIYPWPDTLEYGQSVFNWEKYSEDLCVMASCKKLINTFPEFVDFKNKNQDWLSKLFINADLHHTEIGHNIIANAILKEF